MQDKLNTKVIISKRLTLSEPFINGNEWKYVKECLDTGWVSSAGKFVDLFAEKFSQYVNAKHAIPTSCGTSALHVSLVALGLQPNEEVLVPSLTFIATANVVRYCNAYPVFTDVDDRTLCMDVGKVKDFLEKECIWSNGLLINKSTRRTVRGMIPVHIYGHPVDMDPLLELAQKYNMFILEDATEALGSKYKGKMTGTFGNLSAFSFNGNKIITTGGGGMVVTDNSALAERIKSLTTQSRADSIEYYHNEVGYNYRLTNIQSALGLAQLERIDEFIQLKRHIAEFYQRELGKVVRVCGEEEWAFSTYWLCWIIIQGKSRKQIIESLNAKNIQARPLFFPLHLLPPYRDCQAYHTERSEYLYEHGINIPSHIGLADDDLEFIVRELEELLDKP
ncbi:TPA: LegC family aminotransferase [Candidatus Poribacteria bacterium]|nr:LegC family aminotransferase [Candidatus Poribacteria bacterium]